MAPEHVQAEDQAAAGAAASTVQPRAGTQRLEELNVRSAPCGQWDVGIFWPRIEEWKSPTTGGQGAAFRCILVSAADPTSYLAAQMSTRNADMKPLKRAEGIYKDNLLFRVSKVSLLSDSKQYVLHRPLKLVVNSGKTKTDPLLASTCGVNNLQAQPRMTLSQVQELQQTQRFDVTALVAGFDDTPREVSPSCKVIDVRLLDASGPGGKPQEVRFGFFYDHPPSQATCATIGILREKEALSFFALQGKRTDGGFSVESSRNFFVIKGTGGRAMQLNTAAAGLHIWPYHNLLASAREKPAVIRILLNLLASARQKPAVIHIPL